MQRLYSVTVRNRFAELHHDHDNVTAECDKLVQSNTEAADQLIPVKKKKRKKKLSEDKSVKDARQEVQDAFHNYNSCPSQEEHQNLQEKKSKLQTIYKTSQEEELHDDQRSSINRC